MYERKRLQVASNDTCRRNQLCLVTAPVQLLH